MKSNKPQNEQRRHVDKRKLAIRIVAWVLVAMMVVTGIYTAVYFLVSLFTVHAAETDSDGDISVAVGLLYGSSIDVALTSTTINGYIVGSETVGIKEKSFSELWRLEGCTKATVLCDANYYFDSVSNAYRTPTDATPTNVGAYRLELDQSFSTGDELAAAISAVNSAVSPLNYECVPAYVNGEYKLRIGGFFSEIDAEQVMEIVRQYISSAYGDYALSVKSPSDTGVIVIDHNSTKPLFEYDSGNSYRTLGKSETYECLALDAIDGADGTPAYLKFLSHIYDGVFAFRRYPKGARDGISLLNIAPLEDYVIGVVPYEVSADWPLETLRAFAIVARTYVVSHMDKYWSLYGFNVCGTSNSQVYRGIERVNDNVRTAVTSTAGIVVTYGGALAEMYYSSSTGNCTADVRNVWGNSVEWLRSVQTPWEDYLHHSNSFWKTEVSPRELYEYLSSRYETTGDKDLYPLENLRGDIESITIDAYAGSNSTYVSKVTITDIYGNTAVISRCDKVRKAFLQYLNSANFVVGQGNVEYTEYLTTFGPGETAPIANTDQGVQPMAATPVSNDGSRRTYTVLTADGEQDVDLNGCYVIGADGISNIEDGSYSAVKKDGEIEDIEVNAGGVGKPDTGTPDTGTPSTPNSGDTVGVDGNTVRKVMTASSTDKFIFVGKGWGHGVGLSQWGLRDLADMNLTYDKMIEAYCPGVGFDDYKNVIS